MNKVYNKKSLSSILKEKLNNFKKKYLDEDNKKILMILLIVLALLSSINIFNKGLSVGHDTNFHLHRIQAITDTLKIHKYIPVYFNYLNGLGYGNGLFYPDTFLFVPALFNYMGLSVELSYKIFVLLINFLSLLTIYICVKKITKKNYCAYTSMILYACSLYRLIDFVDRGALGELLAFIFIPLVILGLYEILYAEYKKNIILSIGLIGLCLSHIISLYLVCISLGIVVLINIKKLKDKKRLLSLALNIIFSMLITSFFWMPMLEQVFSNKFNFLANSVDINRNILPIGFLFIDFPIWNLQAYWLPSGIGLVYYYGMYKYFRLKDKDKFLFSIFLVGIFSIIMSTCGIIWKISIFNKIFGIIQFPWRFYMLATSFLTVGICMILKKLNRKTIMIIITYSLIIFMINAVIYKSNIYVNNLIEKDSIYTDNPLKNEIVCGEYLPKETTLEIIDNYKTKNISYERNNEITIVEVKKEKETIEAPLIYYKGYKACGKKCYEVFKTEKGMLGIKTNNELDTINVKYEGTSIQKVSKYITMISICVMVIYWKKKSGEKCE